VGFWEVKISVEAAREGAVGGWARTARWFGSLEGGGK